MPGVDPSRGVRPNHPSYLRIFVCLQEVHTVYCTDTVLCYYTHKRQAPIVIVLLLLLSQCLSRRLLLIDRSRAKYVVLYTQIFDTMRRSSVFELSLFAFYVIIRIRLCYYIMEYSLLEARTRIIYEKRTRMQKNERKRSM